VRLWQLSALSNRKETPMTGRISQIVGALLQSDLAMKLVQNEALMKAMMKAFSVSIEARQLVEAQVRVLMGSLDLAKAEDVEALRQEVYELRQKLDQLRDQAQAAVDGAETADP
jgi:polyhydroxyalkanoate synthesis regulator phasin